MALIIDPDNLHLGTEVTVDTTQKTIKLNIAGNLTEDGVTLQALYSFLKEVWPTDPTLRRFKFPMQAINSEQFLITRGQNFHDTDTKKLLRSGGWAVNPSGNTIVEEWACIIALGPLDDTEQIYYITSPTGTPIDFNQKGTINEPIQIYGDINHGNLDIRNYLKLFVRTWGQTYDQVSIAEVETPPMTYKVYRFSLRTSKDPYITLNESELSGAPYNGMSITFYDDQTPYIKTIGSVDYTFHVVIDANGANKFQLYHWVQSQLRKSTDIDAGPDTHIGKITDLLVEFSIDKLITLLTSYGGVLIENFDQSEINDFAFTDHLGNVVRYPFISVLTIYFNDNLINDPDAVFTVFFLNDDAGDNLGRDWDTENAIIVRDASNNEMSGPINGLSSVQFTYDYENNDQRGLASKGKDAPIVVTSIGRNLAKYTFSEGSIKRTTTNAVYLYAETEYSYNNP